MKKYFIFLILLLNNTKLVALDKIEVYTGHWQEIYYGKITHIDSNYLSYKRAGKQFTYKIFLKEPYELRITRDVKVDNNFLKYLITTNFDSKINYLIESQKEYPHVEYNKELILDLKWLPSYQFKKLIPQLENLKFIFIFECKSLKEDDFIEGMKYFSTIESLNIRGADSLGIRTIKEVVINQKNLKYFCFTGMKITDNEVINQITKLEKLKYLSLVDTKISDTAIISGISKMVNLKGLNIMHCVNITDTAIIDFSKNLINLELLYLEKTKLTDKGLIEGVFRLKKMKYLRLDNTRITDEGFIKSIPNLIDLQTLHVGQCIQLSDKSVNQGIMKLNKLKVLFMWNTSLKEGGVVALLQHPSLNVVLVQGVNLSKETKSKLKTLYLDYFIVN